MHLLGVLKHLYLQLLISLSLYNLFPLPLFLSCAGCCHIKRFAEHQIAVVVNTTGIQMKKLKSFVFESGLGECFPRRRGEDNLLSD